MRKANGPEIFSGPFVFALFGIAPAGVILSAPVHTLWKRGGDIMKKQTVQVQCLFSTEDVRLIFRRSFELYLRRVLAGDHGYAVQPLSLSQEKMNGNQNR